MYAVRAKITVYLLLDWRTNYGSSSHIDLCPLNSRWRWGKSCPHRVVDPQGFCPADVAILDLHHNSLSKRVESIARTRHCSRCQSVRCLAHIGWSGKRRARADEVHVKLPNLKGEKCSGFAYEQVFPARWRGCSAIIAGKHAEKSG